MSGDTQQEQFKPTESDVGRNKKRELSAIEKENIEGWKQSVSSGLDQAAIVMGISEFARILRKRYSHLISRKIILLRELGLKSMRETRLWKML